MEPSAVGVLESNNDSPNEELAVAPRKYWLSIERYCDPFNALKRFSSVDRASDGNCWLSPHHTTNVRVDAKIWPPWSIMSFLFDVTVTVAEAALLGSAWLVATTSYVPAVWGAT